MSAQLPVSLPFRLYNSLISSSTLAYGCEAWKMTLPVQRMINSICSKQLSLITKRTIHQEAKHPTIDALGQIKRRRHEYLGHILRLDPSRLLHTGWPDTLCPPGIEPFAFVRKLMTVFSYYAIFYDTLTKNL